jgi:hypothetical protein
MVFIFKTFQTEILEVHQFAFRFDTPERILCLKWPLRSQAVFISAVRF